MNEKTLNKEQAKQFAYSICGEVAAYVRAHLAEYKAYLSEIGETDDTIFENSEADNEKRTA